MILFTNLNKYIKRNLRYTIVFMLFVITSLSFADRSVLSIAGNAITSDLKIDSVTMGYIFSAFSWSYVIGQIPGGILIDRYGTKLVYGTVIFLWSILSILHGFIGFFYGNLAVILLFTLRLLMGLITAPVFPSNARIVAEWFPSKERGVGTAVFSSAQYFSAVIFAPLIGWITYIYGWNYVFIFLGLMGICFALIWVGNYDIPGKHKRITSEEMEYLQRGGAHTYTNKKIDDESSAESLGKRVIFRLLKNRMIVGVYIAQYSATTITYFFLTWFPVYLITEKSMSVLEVGFVSIFPAFAAFIGAITGGMFSDRLMGKGFSLTLARKIPIITGMLISMSIISANYMDSIVLVISIMSLAFFGKGFGGLGWAVISDISPKNMAGINGALFNTFGNIAGITTPIIIGYILYLTGSFNLALLFIGVNAFVAIVSYVFIVGEIKEAHI
ncbi:MFS transporter [Psychrobacillus sp. FJAT-51614]|uniref:MFS transporter n=1 Tax=Psychrobacillus mangrovi TaxID=3117745 RepID=A0ABU8F4U8_9BACI